MLWCWLQVMPPLDLEMANIVASHLKSKGVKIVFGANVTGFEQVRVRWSLGPWTRTPATLVPQPQSFAEQSTLKSADHVGPWQFSQPSAHSPHLLLDV